MPTFNARRCIRIRCRSWWRRETSIRSGSRRSASASCTTRSSATRTSARASSWSSRRRAGSSAPTRRPSRRRKWSRTAAYAPNRRRRGRTGADAGEAQTSETPARMRRPPPINPADADVPDETPEPVRRRLARRGVVLPVEAAGALVTAMAAPQVSAAERFYRARRIGTTFGRIYLGIRANRFIAERLRPRDMPERWTRFNSPARSRSTKRRSSCAG